MLTITASFKGAPEYDVGYFEFFRLRTEVAHTISEEFGEHYAGMIRELYTSRTGMYDKETVRLIRKYHVKASLQAFLYQSDSDGKLSPAICRALLEQIKDLHILTLYGRQNHPERCISFPRLRELLEECIKRNASLIWY